MEKKDCTNMSNSELKIYIETLRNSFEKKKNSLKKQQLAFSLNNATFAKNPIAYKYNKIVSNKVVKEAVYVFTTAVPSLSYCCYF